METHTTEQPTARPERRKEIRLAAARLMAAMDVELETEATAFSEWWAKEEAIRCSADASDRSDPVLH